MAVPALRPLDGFRILELSWLGPGCVTTWLLADLGAEVVKVEPPDGSDNVRSFAPFVDGEAVSHLVVDRGKKSLAVNLRDQRGRDAFLAVANTADAIVEGFRPGVADRLGIGYDQLRTSNPKITYCSVSGFGAGGPLERVAAHDLNYVARTGMLAMQPPDVLSPLPLQAADYLGAALAAYGVTAGLLQAARTGVGIEVEASLFDGALYSLMLPLAMQLMLGLQPVGGTHMLVGGLACYGVYQCRDGALLTVATLEHKFWQRFCAVAGMAEEAGLNHHDPALQPRLRQRIAEVLASRDRDDWLAAFEGEDVCVAPVLVPAVGEHTAALLTEAGLSTTDVERLAHDGVVCAPTAPSKE